MRHKFYIDFESSSSFIIFDINAKAIKILIIILWSGDHHTWFILQQLQCEAWTRLIALLSYSTI